MKLNLVYQGNMLGDSQSGGRKWLRNATDDLWERTLNQISTKLGKMAYLARLHNPETDRYEHHGMYSVFGEDAAEDALRRSHIEVLMSLLNMSILDQVEDVKSYLESLAQSSRRLVANWEKSKSYNSFLPIGASPAQRELFDANMTLIIHHLKASTASGAKHPD